MGTKVTTVPLAVVSKVYVLIWSLCEHVCEHVCMCVCVCDNLLNVDSVRKASVIGNQREVPEGHTISVKHSASTASLGPWATPPITNSMASVCRSAEEQRAVGMAASDSQRRLAGL